MKKVNSSSNSAMGSFFSKSLVTVFAFRLVFTRILGIYIVKGNSMYPALRDGDLCITSLLEPYTAAEAVAYLEEGTVRFGRIVAAENDTVEILEDGILLVNGYQPAEEIFYPTQPGQEETSIQITVNQNEWYLLNDYRSDLSDSRTYGSIPSESLRGKVIWLIRRRGF